LYSHAGLTFGGVISGYDMSTSLMLDIFNSLIQHCRSQGIKEVVYKAVPYIYHSIPADEDLYALFCLDARLFARNVTSSIYRPLLQSFHERRERTIKRAEKNNLTVKRSGDFRTYMMIVEDVLKQRHGVKPVHTSQEIELLANRFPNNIKLIASFRNETMLAGVLVYESKNVAHTQYSVNSNEGLKLGALDLILKYIINDLYRAIKYFDFGISTEQTGHSLNAGLLNYKESFGASAVMHDIYKFTIENMNKSFKKVE
jgi:lipid II:glycine glycyltransferase (peptidoglycan interpeptide bridge formation enzyme)